MSDADGDIRTWVEKSGVGQNRLARFLGIEKTKLSRILAGERRAPAGFRQRVEGAIELLAGADAAADAARDQFMGAAEIAHRNLLAVQAAEHRPQAHELRRGTGETPEAWHGAAS